MRGARFVLCLLGLLAAPSWSQGTIPTVPNPGGPAAVMASSPEEAGKAAVALWRKQHPELLGGRVALAWDDRVQEANAAAKGAAQADASLRPLRDLGVAAESLDQALDQVDPQTFSGVLWLEVVRGKNGGMAGLSLTHRAPGKAQVTRLEVVLDPPIPPSPDPAASRAEVLLRPKGPICAATLSEGGDELWYASGGRLVRYSVARGEELEGWPAGEGEDSGAGCLLRLPSEGDGAGGIGWCFGGRGVWLAPQGQEYRRGATFEGFPLTEKESKFLKAPWLPEEGSFALQDHQGKDLGRFSELARVRPEGGESLLVLLNRDGSLRVLRANSLEASPAPTEGPVAALAGWRDLVAVAEVAAPNRIRVFKAGEGSGWEGVWTSGPLPGRASALCVGRVRGRISVLAFVADGGQSQALLLPLP